MAIKLKGSTLIENLVVMVLVATAISISLLIYANVLKSTRYELKQYARQKVDQVVLQTKLDRKYSASSFEDIYIILEQDVKVQNQHLISLVVTAYDFEERRLAERRELIYLP